MGAASLRPARLRWTIILGSAAFIGVTLAWFPLLFALFVPPMLGVLGLVALALLCGRWPEDPLAHRRILFWTILGFSLHLLAGLVVSVAADMTVLAPDGRSYHRGAIRLVQHWTSDFPTPRLPGGKEGYYYLLGGVYRIFGPYIIAGLAVNAALSAGLVPLVSDITRRLFDAKAARYVPPLVVLMPGLFIWTSLLLKEAGIVFLIAVIANCAVRLAFRTSLVSLVLLTAGLALLLTFRAWVALALAAGLLASLAVGRRQIVQGVGLGLSFLSLVGLLVVASGLGYTGYQAAVSSNLEEANNVRQELVRTAASGFGPEVDISDPGRAAAFLPRGLFHMMLGPFPWQARGAGQLLALPDVLVWWFLLPSLLLGLRAGWRRTGRPMLILLLPAATTSILLALVLGNYGIISRERIQVIVLLVPFIAFGLSVRAERRGESTSPVAAERAPAAPAALVAAGAGRGTGISGNGSEPAASPLPV